MKVNVFSIGNAHDIKTWSNVPYFFSKALIDEKVQINHINIQSNNTIRRIFKYSLSFPLRFISKIFGSNYDFYYFRSTVNNYLVNRKIKRICRRFPDVGSNIFLTYSFSSYSFSTVPVIHLCDQLYEEVFINREKTPGYFDKRIIKRELKLLRKAHYIFSTNLSTINLLREKYSFGNCELLNYRVNLDIEKIEIDRGEILKQKWDSKSIIFIGKAYYERGVDVLLEAFSLFNQRVNNQYKLHIIGPVINEIPDGSYPEVILHPYLDKGIENEYNIYIDLLQESCMFVYPMRVGPIPAALFEAGFFYSPGIITNIHNIDHDIANYENGILVDKPDPYQFADAMYELSRNRNLWKKLAVNIHKYAAKFTLKAMAQTVIKHIPHTDTV